MDVQTKICLPLLDAARKCKNFKIDFRLGVFDLRVRVAGGQHIKW